MQEPVSAGCPRCQAIFTCSAGTIAQCQCSTVELDAAERRYVSERYAGCLCARCLEELKAACRADE